MRSHNTRITEGSIDDLAKRRTIVQVGRVVVRSEEDKPFKVEPHLYGGNFDAGFYGINEDSYNIEFLCEDSKLKIELGKRLPEGSYVSDFRKYKDGWGGDLYIEVPESRLRRTRLRRVLGAGILALGIAGATLSFYQGGKLDSKVRESCDNPNIEQLHKLENVVYDELREYQSELGKTIDEKLGEPTLENSLPNLEKFVDAANQYHIFVSDEDISEQITKCEEAESYRDENEIYWNFGFASSLVLGVIWGLRSLIRREEEKRWIKK